MARRWKATGEGEEEEEEEAAVSNKYKLSLISQKISHISYILTKSESNIKNAFYRYT